MERVFFIRREDGVGPVLIREVVSGDELLEGLQVDYPHELEVLGSVNGDFFPEWWWHEKLEHWKLRAGWFKGREPVMALVGDALRGALRPPKLRGSRWSQKEKGALRDEAELKERASRPVKPTVKRANEVVSEVSSEGLSEKLVVSSSVEGEFTAKDKKGKKSWDFPVIDPEAPIPAENNSASKASGILRKLLKEAS